MKRKVILTMAIIAILQLTACGREFYKEGDYANHQCDRSSCSNPSVVLLNYGAGVKSYYCEEHLDYARDLRDIEEGMKSSPKCDICKSKDIFWEGDSIAYCEEHFNDFMEWVDEN
jgi:hypothetical protein